MNQLLITVILLASMAVSAQSFKDASGQPCTNLTTARIQVLKKIGDKTYSVLVGGLMTPKQNMVLKTNVTEFKSIGLVPFTLPIFVVVNNEKIKVDMEDGFKREFPLATETKGCHAAGLIALKKQKNEAAAEEKRQNEEIQKNIDESKKTEKEQKEKRKKVEDLWK